MATKKDSVYNEDFKLEGEATITLTGKERMIINNALAKCAPTESDIMPILLIMDKIVKG